MTKKTKQFDLSDLDPGQRHLLMMIMSEDKPMDMRVHGMMNVARASLDDPETAHKLMCGILTLASQKGTSAEVEQAKEEANAAKKEHEQALAELQSGPLRPANFIGPAEFEIPGQGPRGHVVTPDGQERFPILTDDVPIEDLRPGMEVLLDAQGAVMIAASDRSPDVGEQAVFVRRFPGTNRVEAIVHDQHIVLRAAQPLLDALDSEEGVRRGTKLLYCRRRLFAFAAIPSDDDRQHRFLDSQKVPDVIPSRDIGKPNKILKRMVQRVRTMLDNPELTGLFNMRPRSNYLFSGPSGTGKTHHIKGFLYEFYEILKAFTGNEDISSRVIRVRPSDLLSEWFGVTERNMDALFDDIQALAEEEVELADGTKRQLPVVVILEEVEGLGRRRGEFDGGPYDRVITTLLQRLDDPTESLSNLPVIMIATSNRPDLLDSAMWRRLARHRAHFGRLDREGVAAILSKKLQPEFPYASNNGAAPEQLRQDMIDQVTMWLFSPNNGDNAQIEITLRDGSKLTRRRRDFMTGSLIESAVANAIDEIIFDTVETGAEDIGLSVPCIIDSFIDAIKENV